MDRTNTGKDEKGSSCLEQPINHKAYYIMKSYKGVSYSFSDW